MRYSVHHSDNGKYFIFDRLSNSVFCYCGNENLANSTAQSLNTLAEGALDFTKMH